MVDFKKMSDNELIARFDNPTSIRIVRELAQRLAAANVKLAKLNEASSNTMTIRGNEVDDGK